MPSLRSTAPAIGLGALLLSLCVPSPASAHDYYRDGPRLRFGVSGAGGVTAGSVDGPYGGAQLRVGVQWTDGFATYVMGQGMLGVFSPWDSRDDVFGVVLHTLMFEATVGRHFQFGGGPSLDFLFGCENVPENSDCGATSVFFGLDLRAALHFSPFTISFDVHPMWFRTDSMAVLFILGLGVDFG